MLDSVDSTYLLSVAVAICAINSIAIAWVIKCLANEIDELRENFKEVTNKVDKTNWFES